MNDKMKMENLCVAFQAWTFWDGVYDPFQIGEIHSFALNLVHAKIKKSKRTNVFLRQKKYCNYSFRGEVICIYSEEKRSFMAVDNFIVVDTGLYKFFMHDGSKFPYSVGQFIEGQAIVEIDYFIWGEQSHKIENTPDIYYNFLVDKILQVTIPRELIYEDDDVYICPTYSDPSAYNGQNVSEVQDMNNSEDVPCFFLLGLKKIEKEIQSKQQILSEIVI